MAFDFSSTACSLSSFVFPIARFRNSFCSRGRRKRRVNLTRRYRPRQRKGIFLIPPRQQLLAPQRRRIPWTIATTRGEKFPREKVIPFFFSIIDSFFSFSSLLSMILMMMILRTTTLFLKMTMTMMMMKMMMKKRYKGEESVEREHEQRRSLCVSLCFIYVVSFFVF